MYNVIVPYISSVNSVHFVSFCAISVISKCNVSNVQMCLTEMDMYEVERVCGAITGPGIT